jgi:hypothetical protein
MDPRTTLKRGDGQATLHRANLLGDKDPLADLHFTTRDAVELGHATCQTTADYFNFVAFMTVAALVAGITVSATDSKQTGQATIPAGTAVQLSLP